MSYTLIYKTYENDLVWLSYSLKSAEKFLLSNNDISEMIIYTHDVCFNKIIKLISSFSAKLIKNAKIIPVHYDYHGYVKQMTVKLMCYHDVKTEYIIYVDSDCIFTNNYFLKDLFKDGKIIWYITDEITKHNIPVWDVAVEAMTKQPMKYFYMYNCFPFIIKKQTLIDAHIKFQEIHHKTYDNFCLERLRPTNIKVGDKVTDKFSELSKIFTEFEYLGFFAYNFTNDYNFIINERNKVNLKQFWSYGETTDAIIAEIDDALKR